MLLLCFRNVNKKAHAVMLLYFILFLAIFCQIFLRLVLFHNDHKSNHSRKISNANVLYNSIMYAANMSWFCNAFIVYITMYVTHHLSNAKSSDHNAFISARVVQITLVGNNFPCFALYVLKCCVSITSYAFV